jgi:acetylornithine/succinyldiaminopimelate/putrescine aminotransferase
MRLLRLVRAENDQLYDSDGRCYIDLFGANGTVLLGHGRPAVVAAVARQLQQLWISGGLENLPRLQAEAAIGTWLPPEQTVVALYSTGMEAAEFAMRLARGHTGRTRLVGFSHGMHGKSLATASLCWDNPRSPRTPDLLRLPFLPEASEEVILERLEAVLAERTVAAVFLEPLQGIGGGHAASPRFAQEVRRTCDRYGTLLVLDEILTGFWRTGVPFVWPTLGIVPDVLLLGKAMGNGFPVSAVAAKRGITVTNAMLPGSTFSGNPLAAAAVTATLEEMRRLPMAELIQGIEATIRSVFASLEKRGFGLRGRGALWVLEPPANLDISRVAQTGLGRGVAAGMTGRLLRLSPAATIDPDRLRDGCTILANILLEAPREDRS